MRFFSILLILLSLNTLTACESKQDKIANLERKIQVAGDELANCLRKVKNYNEENCSTEKQEYNNLQEEYKKLVKSS